MRYFTNVYAKDYPLLAWSIIELCNFKCPYCAANMQKHQSGRMASMALLTKTRKAIADCSGKIELELLGGEPTLHPRLDGIISTLAQLDNVVNIGVLTNAYNYRKLPPGKAWCLCTYHPYKRYLRQYLDNVSRYLDDGIPVVLTTTYQKHYHDEFMAIQQFASNHGLTFDPTYIFYNNKVSIPDHEVGSKIFTLDGVPLSQVELFDRKLNSFTGWMCAQRMLHMGVDGTISTRCQDIGTISAQNLEPMPIRCQHEWCVLDEQIEDPKWLG